MNRLAFTYFPHLTVPVGKRVVNTWSALVDRMRIPKVVADKHEAPGISLATYRGDHRNLANVERVFAVGLDLDHLDALSITTPHWGDEVLDAFTWDELVEVFSETECFLHTTWSSRPDALRARVFLQLSRSVSADEYRRVYRACARLVESWGLIVDRAASDPSRFWFLPSVPPDGKFRCAVGRGNPVDVDGALLTEPSRPAHQDPPRPMSIPAADSSIEDRAARYLDRCDPAISGQGGHNHTFFVAQKIVRGFGLDEETAFRLLSDWNVRCSPPWSAGELRRKVREAAQRGGMAWGSLRDADRRAS